jgi:hypothetical protein
MLSKLETKMNQCDYDHRMIYNVVLHTRSGKKTVKSEVVCESTWRYPITNTSAMNYFGIHQITK